MSPRDPSRRSAPQPTELVRHLASRFAFSWANVVLSTPPAGFARGRHEHRCAYVSLTVSGGWRETYRGSHRECGPGSLAVHLPEAPHARLSTHPGTRELYLEVGPEELPGSWSRKADSASWNLVRPLMHALLADLALFRDDPLHAEALAAELVEEFFGRSARTLPRREGWMRRVREALEGDLERPPTLRSLSRRIGTHPSHLARTFRAAYGLSVGQYVQRLRIGRALEALRSPDRPLAAIAAETGFSDQSHFGRIFRRHIGVSPGRYRRILRG